MSAVAGAVPALGGVVESLNVGRAGTLRWRGREVRSAIVKEPVDAALLRREGFEGDEQADRRVHGGPDKAVCCYPAEHRPEWARLLETELPVGAFGENLLLRGLLERDVHVGDVFRLGPARVQVAQPRGPCFKLAARWRKRTLPARMAREARSGWYFRVLEGGLVGAGDRLALEERRSAVSIADVLQVTYGDDRGDPSALERVLAVAELAEAWRRPLAELAAQQQLPLRDFGLDD